MSFIFKQSVMAVSIMVSFSEVVAVNSEPISGSQSVPSSYFEDNLDYFCNLSFYHARNNRRFWGANNETSFGVNPVISVGNFTLENDGIYGKNTTNYYSDIVKNSLFNNNYSYGDKLAQSNKLKHTYHHGYSKLSYNDKKNNFRAVFGDISPSVTFGTMQGIAGVGFAITRYEGMYDFSGKKKINSQSAITLVYPSKVEVKHNGCIVQCSFYSPGTYSIFDLAPEARAGDGYEIKITDPMNRSYSVHVDLHGDKEVLPQGKDEFELLVVAPNRVNDFLPYGKRYEKHLLTNAVYRYGITDNITLSGSIQAYRDQFIGMVGANVKTGLGLFAQSIGISSNSDSDDAVSGNNGRKAFSFETFYSTQWTKLGKLDVLFSILGKGYSDLGRGLAAEQMVREFAMFNNANDLDIFCRNEFIDSQKVHLNIRYAPVKFTEDLTLALAYDCVWQEQRKDHSYDVCVDLVLSPKLKWAFGMGLTLRDYTLSSKPRENTLKKRFYVALNWHPCEQIEVSSSYDYDVDRRGDYSITYKPKKFKGLELEFNPVSKGGSQKWRSICYKIKYSNEFFDVKFDHSNNRTLASRANKERIFFNTCFSNGKFCNLIKTHYMFTNSLHERKSKKK